MSLYEKLGQVSDKSSFLEFVKALIEDWETEDAEIRRKKEKNLYSPVWDTSEWKSGTIGSYLESAVAWAEATESKWLLEPSWRSFAEFLYAGKLYE